MAWVLSEEDTYADEVLDALRSQSVITPVHWRLEIANGLLMAEKRGRLTTLEANEAYRSLVSLETRIDEHTPNQLHPATMELARHHGLTIYDAAYLELALRLTLPIATLDRHLRVAMLNARIDLFRG